MPSAQNWFNLGDQFAISHVCLSGVDQQYVNIPAIFVMAQAIESYLKGCLVHSGAQKKPLQYGHNLFEIYSELKAQDTFLPDINIDKKVYDQFSIDHLDGGIKSSQISDMIEKYYSLLLCFKYG